MNAYVSTYRGIGDTIYSIPAIAEFARECEYVYGGTAFPHLYSSIPNFRAINPFESVCSGEWTGTDLNPMYYEHCYETRGEFFTVDYDLAERIRLKMPVRSVNLRLEQFQPGKNMIRHCFGDYCPPNPVLKLPIYSGRFDGIADRFLDMIRGDRKFILFHSSAQILSGTVSHRSCPNEMFEYVRKKLKGFALFDCRKFDSDRPTLFPQRQVPIYHSSGWSGICGIMALLKRCHGVVLQNSCSLLPLAQAAGKPVLCFNGPCGLRLEHCTDAGLPEQQRRHVWCEADERCECKTQPVECRKPEPKYSKVDQKISEFLDMV